MKFYVQEKSEEKACRLHNEFQMIPSNFSKHFSQCSTRLAIFRDYHHQNRFFYKNIGKDLVRPIFVVDFSFD